jgi:hypothetical protein
MSKWIACVIFESLYFLLLYLVAFFSNKNYREDDDILWVSRSQWRAIFLMWIPTIFAWLVR